MLVGQNVQTAGAASYCIWISEVLLEVVLAVLFDVGIFGCTVHCVRFAECS